MKRRVPIPVHPPHPERICWGCNKYCPADDMACGSDTMRSMHPVELFGDDWLEWSSSRVYCKFTRRDTHRLHNVRSFLEYVLRRCKT